MLNATARHSEVNDSFLITILLSAALILIATAVSAQEGFGGFGEEEQLADVSAVFSVSSVEPGGTETAAAIITIAHSWHINSSNPHEDWLIPASVSVGDVEGFDATNLVYPAGFDAKLADMTMSVYEDRVVVFFDLAVANSVEPGEYEIPVDLKYQACNDRECRPPQTSTANLAVTVGAAGTAVNQSIFATTSDTPAPEEAVGSAQPESQLAEVINKYGFWGYIMALGIAFVTGLLLSFSPCTYPMIPITVSIFAGQERSVGKGFIMSLFYVGSMAVMYGIMGLIVSLVGGVFGAWLANPAVVIGIAVVFVIFSLSMFGLYELQVPSALRQKLGTTQTGGGVVGSIVLGIIAALVVSPCVGPFVAGILLYVATYGSPFFGFLVLFIFAIGLGTLYIIIGTFSSAITSLPGAGEWMETVKKFFGFVLLLMALYFLRTVLATETIALLTGLLLLAFGVFGGGLDRLTSESKFFPRLKKFLGILAFLLGAYLLMGTIISQGFILPGAEKWLPTGGVMSQSEEESLIPWETDLEAGLARAELEGKPVLIDTWATWCVNCKVLEEKTFKKENVAAAAERFVPIKVQLETADSPITKAFVKKFGLKHYSLPTTLLLDSEGKVQRTLQGVVGPEDMIAEMSKIK